MPLYPHCETQESLSLEAFEAAFNAIGALDQHSILSNAHLFKMLGNNRHFLVSMINDQLKDYENLQRVNAYSPSVFYIYGNKHYFIRANFWPSGDDPTVVSSGDEAFFYGAAHDHNFDFLTIGYYGPGYDSRFYEYDATKVVGLVGEPVDLKFVGTERLHLGRLMYYRRSLDVHEQLHPESFSISLNLVPTLSIKQEDVDQYLFELRSGTIDKLININPLPYLCRLASYIGDGNSEGLMDSISRRHPYDRVRYEAFSALSKLNPSDAASVWRRALDDPSERVRTLVKLRIGRAT